MSRITLSADTAALLEAARAGAELCGPDGRRLGYFTPEHAAAVEERADLYAEPTREQLDAIEAAGGGIPHAEAMKRLGLE